MAARYLQSMVREAAKPESSPPIEAGKEKEAFLEWVGAANFVKFDAAVKKALTAYLKSKAPVKIKVDASVPEIRPYPGRGVYRVQTFRVQGKGTVDFLRAEISCTILSVPGPSRWDPPTKVLGPPVYRVTAAGRAQVSSNSPDMRSVGGILTDAQVRELDANGVAWGWLPEPVVPGKEKATAEAVRKFLSGLRTWFRDDSEEDDDPHYVHLATRSHGIRGDDGDFAGNEDKAEAERLKKALEVQFGSTVKVTTQAYDEWVSINVEIK